MSIYEDIAFDKEGKPVRFRLFREVWLALAVLLVGVLGFGLGRLSGAGQRSGVEIRYDSGVISALSSSTPATAPKTSSQPQVAQPTGSTVYASSKGTKYYYSSCASSVSPANKITFASAAAAEAAGYTLASTCHTQ